jgi:hypothetical protein
VSAAAEIAHARLRHFLRRCIVGARPAPKFAGPFPYYMHPETSRKLLAVSRARTAAMRRQRAAP